LTTEVAQSSNWIRSLRLPGILLGLGLGGFADGIVLHQILQWHHMLTSEGSYPKTTVAGLEANTLADGLFHASTWILATVGVWLLWRTAREHGGVGPGRVLAGWMLLGWGLFNVVEGIVDHHLLGIHHVREGANQTAWDLGFLAFGALLLIVGWLLTRERDDELAEGRVVNLGTARHASGRRHGRHTTRPDTSEPAGRR
jgi:uncharacterized membrane protein